MIDGHSILRMGLRPLRTAVGIIPQDPTLFSGTLVGKFCWAVQVGTGQPHKVTIVTFFLRV